MLPPPPPPSSGLPLAFLPPPPGIGRSPRERVFGPIDAVALAVIGVVLIVVDLVFIAIAKHAGSHRSGGPVVVWFAVQAAIVLFGGIVQGVRRRPWWEVGLVAAVAAAVLAFTVLVTADPTAGTAQCPGSQPCDTSFGLGAIFIGGVAFVVLGAVTAAGRALGGAVKRGTPS